MLELPGSLLPSGSREHIEVCPDCLLTIATVALLLGQLDHGLSVLCGLRVGGQLAQHILSLCVRLYFTRRHPDPQSRWPKTIHHDCRRSHTPRQLDPVRSDEGWSPWEFRGRYVRAAVDGVCSTLCSFSAHEIFRLVVHQSREDSSDSGHESC